MAQAFDKVWHKGLLQKLRKVLPPKFCHLHESYISDRHFRVKQEQAYSQIKEIKAGVPQGSVLGPVLYLLFTSDIPLTEGTTMGTFADDTAIISVGDTIAEANNKLQSAIGRINIWTKRWRIKLNETKSVRVYYIYESRC